MRELALTLAKQGDRQGAMNAWAKVLEIVPGDADALRQYAVLLWQNGEQAKADAIIRQALEGQTTPNANLEAAAGDYYTLTGRRAEALQRLEKAATLDPEDRTRDFALASGHLRMGRAQEAADVASRLTRDFPTDVRAWQVLAVAKSILGDRTAAETAYREWLRLAPQDPKGPANFGFFLHQTGRDAEARDLLAQSSVRFPREGMIWLNYATVLDTLGDTQAATAARQQASNLLTAEEKQLLIR
jgi:Flp pilus assembly protein TadD